MMICPFRYSGIIESPYRFTASVQSRKAWKNEKLANIRAMIEGRPQPASEPTPYNIPTGNDPAFAAGCVAYYGDAGRYYGD